MTPRASVTFYKGCKAWLHRRIALELAQARRVVDLGCGDCRLATLLSNTGHHEVIGVDVSGGSFPRRSSRGGSRRCIRADAQSLRFLSRGSVDSVVSVWALHEFEAPVTVLREAKRILRPDGEILIVDFPRGSLAQRLWNENYYTTRKVGEMLKRVGFVRVQARRIARKQLTWARGFKASRRKGSRIGG